MQERLTLHYSHILIFFSAISSAWSITNIPNYFKNIVLITWRCKNRAIHRRFPQNVWDVETQSNQITAKAFQVGQCKLTSVDNLKTSKEYVFQTGIYCNTMELKEIWSVTFVVIWPQMTIYKEMVGKT